MLTLFVCFSVNGIAQTAVEMLQRNLFKNICHREINKKLDWLTVVPNMQMVHGKTSFC